MKVILASSSARRIEYLSGWGFDFKVEKASIREVKFNGDPIKTVILNAYSKAYFVAQKYRDDIVVGMDTEVVLGKRILGKPSSFEKNVKMLKMLSGKTHRVITGICAIKSTMFVLDYIETKVSFRKLSIEELERYCKTREGLDKTGGYAIQGLASDFVIGVEGLMDNVIGIPVVRLRKVLNKILET